MSHRLEKLDGSFNVFFPKCTLNIQTPLGGKKGIVKWEVLILQLYPWLSISETSTDEMSVTVQMSAPQTNVENHQIDSGVVDIDMTGKELEKYLSPSVWPIVLGTIVFVVGVFGAIAARVGAAAVFFGLLAILIMAKTLTLKMNLQSLLEKLKEQESWTEIVMEFKSAKPYINDSVRLGQAYLFGKNAGTLVKYEEISQIYQWIHKTNFVEDKRELRIVLKNEETFRLCELPLKGEADKEVREICIGVKRKNPSAEIGI